MDEKKIYTYPACKFCGQAAICDREFNSQDEAVEYATMHCSCSDAFEYRLEKEKQDHREEALEELKSNIDELVEYASQRGIDINDSVCNLIYECGEQVIDGCLNLTKVTVGALSIKISPSKNGIVFATSYTESMKKEV